MLLGKVIMLKIKTDGALIPFSEARLPTAMFTGIIVALIATEIFVKVTKAGWVIKMPEQVPPAVSRAFSVYFLLDYCSSFRYNKCNLH